MSGAVQVFSVMTPAPKSLIYVDTNILVNFDKIGRLDALTYTGRKLVITEEVFREAVTDAIMTGRPDAVYSADRIEAWIRVEETAGRLEFRASQDDLRPLEFGADAGERSIAASINSVKSLFHDAIVLSDDGGVALKSMDGASAPTLTGQYYLVSLVFSGAISVYERMGTVTI
jgi:hypothetical protein